MSTTLPLDKYEELVRRSGLVDASALERVLSESRVQNDAGVSALANRLMRANLITAWQNDKILQGKSRGFFLGKYKLLSHLTKGGMSDVFLAESPEYKRVALKIFPPHLIEQASYLERFKQEARTQAEMNHPNIVRALDFGQEGRIYFYVMEFVDGLDLNRLVEVKGPLPYRTAIEYMVQATEALEYAHKQGMVHRDIKPANLMQDADGRIKLLDLGLARITNDEVGSLTIKHNENSLGTADYVAPEQAIDSHNVDERADVYSLGGTLYYLLMGHPPFPDGTPVQRMMAHMNQEPAPIRSKRTDCSEGLQAIVTKMMCKRPDDRFASMAEVREAMTAWLKANAAAKSAAKAPAAAAAAAAKPAEAKPAEAKPAAAKPGDSRLAELKIAAAPKPAAAAAAPKPAVAPPKSGGSQPIPAGAAGSAAPPAGGAASARPAADPKTPPAGSQRPSPEAGAAGGTVRPAQTAAAAARTAPAAAAPRPAAAAPAAGGAAAPTRPASQPAAAPPAAGSPAAAPPAAAAPSRPAPPPENASGSYLNFNTASEDSSEQSGSYSSVSDSSEDASEASQDSPSELIRRARKPALSGTVVALEFTYAMVLGLTAALVPVAIKQLQSQPLVIAVCGLMLGAAFTLLRFAFMLNVKR